MGHNETLKVELDFLLDGMSPEERKKLTLEDLEALAQRKQNQEEYKRAQERVTRLWDAYVKTWAFPGTPEAQAINERMHAKPPFLERCRTFLSEAYERVGFWGLAVFWFVIVPGAFLWTLVSAFWSQKASP